LYVILHADSANDDFGDDRFGASIASGNWLVGEVARAVERDAATGLGKGSYMQ